MNPLQHLDFKKFFLKWKTNGVFSTRLKEILINQFHSKCDTGNIDIVRQLKSSNVLLYDFYTENNSSKYL